MASEIKRAVDNAPVSAEKIMQIARADTSPRLIRWHGASITVRPLLPFQETRRFIDSVMSACFDRAHDTAVPEAMDFAIRANVVLRYSNAELPENIEEQYMLLYASDLYDAVKAEINEAQLKAITRALELCVTRTA